MTEADLRQRLAPYSFDGTEAVDRLVALMTSHSRPADLRRAISKILQRFYASTVTSILNGEMP